MDKDVQLSLVIFRRDLRLEDNTALISACRDSNQVIPCFIFDDAQINAHDYFSPRSFAFLCQSLAELDAELQQKGTRLYIFKGKPDQVVDELLTTLPIDAVYVNRDYTPFSRDRDEKIARVVEQHERAWLSFDDALLQPPESVHKDDGTPYTVYTPFMKRSRLLEVLQPQRNRFENYYSALIKQHQANLLAQFLKQFVYDLLIPGGRNAGKRLLKSVQSLTDYKEKRDFPALNKTSHLSAHNKFGTVSIREVYYFAAKHLGAGCTFINELYWRDFYTHIAVHFPHVFGQAFQEKYRGIRWSLSQRNFDRWCQGETGFPIVDAGMRQLNETGYMHNRVRMIVASFLVKDLHIDWRWGEKYFAQQLIDYDPAVNNGSWQWAASTGCDAQPYFRIFNPALQEKRFDPEGEYVKTWLGDERFEPIVDHKEAAAEAKRMFKVEG